MNPCFCSVSLPENILIAEKNWVYSPPKSISASLEMAGGSSPRQNNTKAFPLLSFTLPLVTQAAPLQRSFILQHQIKAGSLNGNLPWKICWTRLINYYVLSLFYSPCHFNHFWLVFFYIVKQNLHSPSSSNNILIKQEK